MEMHGNVILVNINRRPIIRFEMITGTGTKFVTYLSPSPTLFKNEMSIYWPIMKNKVTNNDYTVSV